MKKEKATATKAASKKASAKSASKKISKKKSEFSKKFAKLAKTVKAKVSKIKLASLIGR